MANKGNGLPTKVYKRMLTESYLQNVIDGASIRNYLNKNKNPILQKEDRYIPPRTRGNVLTEEYIKKMANKPEKNHIRRIPLKNNLSSGVRVITVNLKKEGIKMNPKIRKNDISYKSYEDDKHLRTFKTKDNLKNFYLDNFNSAKQNLYELNRKNTSVSNQNIYAFF